MHMVTDCLQNSLLILNEFKRVNFYSSETPGRIEFN